MRALLLTVALYTAPFSGASAFGQVVASSEAYPKVNTDSATVGIQYHQFVLLRCDGNIIALHVMPDPRFGWDGINYRWYHLTDGSDKFFLLPPGEVDASPNRRIETGAGDTDEGAGDGEIKAGPITMGWSKGGQNSGWLYLKHVRDKVLVYPEQFRRLEDCSGKLDAQEWKPLFTMAGGDRSESSREIGEVLTIANDSFAGEVPQTATPDIVRVIRTTKGIRHWDRINFVAYSPGGRTLASASSDKTVIIWSPETGRELQIFKGHKSAVTCVVFSPDEKLLASGDTDGMTKVWAGESGRELHNLKIEPEPWPPHRGGGGRQPVDVRAVAFSPDGKSLASASQGSTTLWSVNTGQQIRRFSEQEYRPVGEEGPFARQQVTSIAFIPDGKILVSTNAVGHVTLWSVGTGERLRTFNESVGEPKWSSLPDQPRARIGVAFSPDGKLLASITGHSAVELRSVETGQQVHVLRPTNGRINNLAFSPNGATLATSGAREVTLWSAQTGNVVARRKTGSNDPISCLAFDPNGKTVAYVPFPNRTVNLWSIDAPSQPQNPSGYFDYHWSAALSPDGSTLLSADYEEGRGVLKLWSAETGKELRTLISETGTIFHTLVLNPSKELVACCSVDLTKQAQRGEHAHVKTFSTVTGKRLHSVRGPASNLVCSKDGSFLASSSAVEGIEDLNRQTRIKLWDAENLEELRTLAGHEKAIFSLAFSPDASTLASGSLDRTVKLWSVPSGAERLTFTGHAKGPSRAVVGGDTRDAVRILAFNPDGKTVVSGTVDVLKLWSIDTGEEIQTLTRPKDQRLPPTTTSWFTSAIFSPGGRTLASASRNGRLIFWDPTSGRPWHSWMFPGKTSLLGFSLDGRLLATQNANGTCYLLRVPPHRP